MFLRPPKGQPPMAAVALGTNPRENLFVGVDGRWFSGFYIPAYLRRYPFITGDTQDKTRKAVFVDVESPRISREDGLSIYENDGLVEDRQGGGRFLRPVPRPGRAVPALLARAGRRQHLHAAGLPGRDRARAPKREPRLMMAIDERRLRAVSDTLFLDWRAKNWLPAIYLHLFSLAHFGALANLAKRRAAAGPQVIGNA